MKSMKSLVLIAAIPLVVISAASVAHESKDGHACHGKRSQVNLDTDGDGKITQKEFIEGNAKRAESKFAKLDTNKDGVIDAAEQQSWKDSASKHYGDWKNKDGKTAPVTPVPAPATKG